VCCIMLQWVAVGCSGLQCDTSKCGQRRVSLIQSVSLREAGCSVLQWVAVGFSGLKCVASEFYG